MRNVNRLIGMTAIALFVASATAAPAVDVNERQVFNPFGFSQFPDPFVTNFGFSGASATSAPSATATPTPSASSSPGKRQFFPVLLPIIPPFVPSSVPFVNDNQNAQVGSIGSAEAESASSATPSIAPEKRQLFPFFPFVDPEAFGIGAQGSGNADAGASVGAVTGSEVTSAAIPAASATPEKRQFFPFAEPFLVPLAESAAAIAAEEFQSTSASASVPIASDAPEKRQFFPFVDPFFFPTTSTTGGESGRSRAASSTSAVLPIATDALEKRQFFPFVDPAIFASLLSEVEGSMTESSAAAPVATNSA
ncbi:hypothetical protein SCHPADRAFT_889868 [Schizopora paradoxa]|uniref:Uncharacterized protein n=1 Tax=Schizopora paradoxa TaxID=27342 RepID=A0A0H2RPV9_9AGAM|nr:hypothetical protein SCHPADRAFT_889868 [Schizopora paradoxa]